MQDLSQESFDEFKVFSKRKTSIRTSSLSSSSMPFQTPPLGSLASRRASAADTKPLMAQDQIKISKEPVPKVKAVSSSLTRDAVRATLLASPDPLGNSPTGAKYGGNGVLQRASPSPAGASSPEKQTQSEADALNPSLLDGRLKSYGPYIRVYERSINNSGMAKGFHSSTESNQSRDHSVKYTSIIDVTSSREKLFSTSYPTIAITPPGMKRVVIGSPDTKSGGFSSSTGAPSTILSLSRPTSNRGNRYARSTGSSSSGNPRFAIDDALSPNGSPIARNQAPIDPSIPLLPFLNITNALQLHLKMNVLDENERILVWATGSSLVQAFPFVPTQDSVFSFISLFNPRHAKDGVGMASIDTLPPLHFPAYLLLTSKHVYICKPLFKLAKIKFPFQDEQTSYMNPTKLFEIQHQLSLPLISRIDVGPGRQYVAFHCAHKLNSRSEKDITSIVFQTRSRLMTTQIVDAIQTINHETNEFSNAPPLNNVNQDVEWCIKSLQNYILLRPGPKPVRLLSYLHVWPSSFTAGDAELSPSESDNGIHEVITRVDFDFVKAYLFGVFLRYVKPVAESDARGVELQHITLLASREYLYVMEERLDAWPPSVFPPEISPSLAAAQPALGETEKTKGYLIDKVPQFHLLGVGRLKDVTRIERWRSWRLDASLGTDDFKGLGRALQNGHLGYLNHSVSHLKQQASTTGWFWWVRVYFGYRDNSLHPTTPPTQVPPDGYWWDLVFGTRESSGELIDAIRTQRGGRQSDIQFVLGDD
ncbi:hypothetical protein HDV03_003713 [Kappamyces sp. JEL0829]|nr:hypothetical protein HDV03_003713 [Kappamyces sp. JEL0829]